MKNVAIVGTQGVPARYGGFETLVENIIGKNCPLEVQYTVFCSSKDFKKEERLLSYKGALLKYVPLHANGFQSTPYDIWSLLKVMRGYDVIVILGVSGCIFLPVFRLFCRKRLVINIDGLEHRRAKWGKFARWFLRFSEAMAVRFADVIVADNKGIQDYVLDVYGKDSALIACETVGRRGETTCDIGPLWVEKKRVFVHGVPYRAGKQLPYYFGGFCEKR